MQSKTFYAFLLSTLLLCITGFSSSALANSGGGSASAGNANIAKLDPFTVNLDSFDRYLQITVTLQVASAEIAEKVKVLMPMIRHGLIVILSSKEAAALQSGEGKREVMDEIRDRVNKVLEVKEHDGVTDIFFENFIIQ